MKKRLTTPIAATAMSLGLMAAPAQAHSAVRHPDHLKGKPLSERAYKEGEPF